MTLLTQVPMPTKRSSVQAMRLYATTPKGSMNKCISLQTGLVLWCITLSTLAQTAPAPATARNAQSGRTFFTTGFPDVHGNGRTCATCHVPEQAFQLTPQNVEARYQALQQRLLTDPQADDPLFRSIDANDGVADFTNLRQHALVRVTVRLPTDANGQKLVWPADDPDATKVSLWRSAPTVLNTAITAPYQLDGRQPTLQSQALGALIDHSQITVAPRPQFLDAVAAFEGSQFSSEPVKLLADALATGQPLPPTDPPLNELETRGKALFDHHCAVCHGGPALTTVLPAADGPGIRNIFVSKPVPPFAEDLPFAPSPLQPRLWAFRVPGQTDPVVVPSTDPGRALLTGDIANLNEFDVPTLFGISKTAPYFHDNSAATLEDVMRHYQLLFIAVQRVLPTLDLIQDEQIPPLLAYLRRI